MPPLPPPAALIETDEIGGLGMIRPSPRSRRRLLCRVAKLGAAFEPTLQPPPRWCCLACRRLMALSSAACPHCGREMHRRAPP